MRNKRKLKFKIEYIFLAIVLLFVTVQLVRPFSASEVQTNGANTENAESAQLESVTLDNENEENKPDTQEGLSISSEVNARGRPSK